MQGLAKPLRSAGTMARAANSAPRVGEHSVEDGAIEHLEALTPSVIVGARAAAVVAVLFGRSLPATLWPLDDDGVPLPDARGVQAILAPGRRLFVEWKPSDRVELRVPCRVVVRSAYVDYSFDVEHLVDGVVLGGPGQVHVTPRRKHRRVPAPPRLRARLRDPGDPQRTHECAVLEVSLDGFSFATDSAQDALGVGMLLPDLEVTWKSGLTLRVPAKIRHITPRTDGSGSTCGVELLSSTTADLERWQAEVSKVLHPNTTGGPVGAEKLWPLYSDSGYFDLAGDGAAFFAPLQGHLRAALPKLASARRLAAQAHVVSERRVEASLSTLRPWEHGRITYQLARFPSEGPMSLSGNTVLLDLYRHAYEHAQLDPYTRWHVIYIRKDARFSRLLHHDFCLARAHEPTIGILPFRPLQKRSLSEPTAPFPTGVEVGVATREERVLLLQQAAATLPAIYNEAVDLIEGSLEEQRVRQEWRDAGLARHREVLTVRRSGVPVAAAVVDMIEPGAHLYGLVDQVHLFVFTPGDEACVTALMQGVERWYWERGASQYVLFDFGGAPLDELAGGFRPMGDADVTLMHNDWVPEFLEYLFELTCASDIRTSGVVSR